VHHSLREIYIVLGFSIYIYIYLINLILFFFVKKVEIRVPRCTTMPKIREQVFIDKDLWKLLEEIRCKMHHKNISATVNTVLRSYFEKLQRESQRKQQVKKYD